MSFHARVCLQRSSHLRKPGGILVVKSEGDPFSICSHVSVHTLCTMYKIARYDSDSWRTTWNVQRIKIWEGVASVLQPLLLLVSLQRQEESGMQSSFWIERKKKLWKVPTVTAVLCQRAEFSRFCYFLQTADRPIVDNMSVMASLSDLMQQFYIISFYNLNLQCLSTTWTKRHRPSLMIIAG